MGKVWGFIFMKNFSRWQNWIFGPFWPLDWKKITQPPLSDQKGPLVTETKSILVFFRLNNHFWPFWTILSHFWPFRSNFGPFLSPNSNLSQTSHVTTQNDRKRGRISMEMVSEVTLKTWGHLGSFWGHFGTIPGQFVAPNSKLSQTSHVTTQNDRKRSRILMEMVSEVTLKTLRPFQALFCNFWVILGSFGAILGPKMTWTSWSWVSKPSSSAFCSTYGRFEWSHD